MVDGIAYVFDITLPVLEGELVETFDEVEVYFIVIDGGELDESDSAFMSAMMHASEINNIETGFVCGLLAIS